ncbi:unnamed protein product [Amoebophrya sp. A120]|nr:unnamed protein product [Amoebophrya sp. A120]|eukprot:GSA120T00009994001.1
MTMSSSSTTFPSPSGAPDHGPAPTTGSSRPRSRWASSRSSGTNKASGPAASSSSSQAAPYASRVGAAQAAIAPAAGGASSSTGGGGGGINNLRRDPSSASASASLGIIKNQRTYSAAIYADQLFRPPESEINLITSKNKQSIAEMFSKTETKRLKAAKVAEYERAKFERDVAQLKHCCIYIPKFIGTSTSKKRASGLGEEVAGCPTSNNSNGTPAATRSSSSRPQDVLKNKHELLLPQARNAPSSPPATSTTFYDRLTTELGPKFEKSVYRRSKHPAIVDPVLLKESECYREVLSAVQHRFPSFRLGYSIANLYRNGTDWTDMHRDKFQASGRTEKAVGVAVEEQDFVGARKRVDEEQEVGNTIRNNEAVPVRASSAEPLLLRSEVEDAGGAAAATRTTSTTGSVLLAGGEATHLSDAVPVPAKRTGRKTGAAPAAAIVSSAPATPSSTEAGEDERRPEDARPDNPSTSPAGDRIDEQTDAQSSRILFAAPQNETDIEQQVDHLYLIETLLLDEGDLRVDGGADTAKKLPSPQEPGEGLSSRGTTAIEQRPQQAAQQATRKHQQSVAEDHNVTIGVSFGATRTLAFKHLKTSREFSFPQHDGDLFAFTTPVNSVFQHSIPIEKNVYGSRISLIFWGRVQDEKLM